MISPRLNGGTFIEVSTSTYESPIVRRSPFASRRSNSESSMYSAARWSLMGPLYACCNCWNLSLRDAVVLARSSITCGVHQTSFMPMDSSRASTARESSRVATPSSTPKRMWEWESAAPERTPSAREYFFFRKSISVCRCHFINTNAVYITHKSIFTYV